MFQIVKELILPICLALVGIVIPSIKLLMDNNKLKAEQLHLKKENKALVQELKDSTLGLKLDLEAFNKIKVISETLAMKTSMDRFLILTASNGKTELRYATVAYEHHKDTGKISLSIGATSKYIKFEFDSVYKQMLKDCENQGVMTYEVDKMIPGDLKNIYESEGVTHSKVFFLMRGKIDNENDRMFYCSVSTHGDNSFTATDSIIFKAQINILKGLFEEMLHNDEAHSLT